MSRKNHWQQVYSTKPSDRLGWYKPRLQTSLKWIEELKLPKDASIIDICGGASTLVDDLLDSGYQSITVLDISENALSVSRERLGSRSKLVTWLSEDITCANLPISRYDLWHDRAVFHFLTEPDDQRRYRDRLLRTLKPDGHVVIGVFAPEAPPRCSGLPVQRYSLDHLVDTLGTKFRVARHHKELHITPGGVEQMYLYCQLRRTTKPAE